MSRFLTDAQRIEAEKYEAVIDQHLGGYVSVGKALIAIQDGGLHEDESFDDYVERRFEIKVYAAYRTIRATKVAMTLDEKGLPVPANEGQAHALHELNLEPEELVEYWQELLQSGERITGKRIAAKRRLVVTTAETPTGAASQAAEQNAFAIASDGSFETPIELNSVRQFSPPKVKPSSGDPLPCLQQASQLLLTVTNAIDKGGFDEFSSIEGVLNEVEKRVAQIRSAMSAVSIAA